MASSWAPVWLSTSRSARAVVARSTILAPWLSSFVSAMRRITTRCCSILCQDRMFPAPRRALAAGGKRLAALLGSGLTTDAAVAVGSMGLSCSDSAGILLWVKAWTARPPSSGMGVGDGAAVVWGGLRPMVRSLCRATASVGLLLPSIGSAVASVSTTRQFPMKSLAGVVCPQSLLVCGYVVNTASGCVASDGVVGFGSGFAGVE